jgi:type IV secretion system protein VirB11
MRPLRPVDLRAHRDHRFREKLHRELGADVRAALADPSVVEIVLNEDGSVWIERLGKPIERTGVSLTRIQAETLLGTVAALTGREVHEDRPIIEAELPFDGSRFEGVLPPVARSPVFAIRRRALRVISLGEYVSAGILDAGLGSQLKGAYKLAVARREERWEPGRGRCSGNTARSRVIRPARDRAAA